MLYNIRSTVNTKINTPFGLVMISIMHMIDKWKMRESSRCVTVDLSVNGVGDPPHPLLIGGVPSGGVIHE